MMATVTVSMEPQSQLTEYELDGVWNGIEVAGFGEAYYDAETNITGGVLDFEDIPELGSMLMAASKTSWLSLYFCVFSKPMNGAVNLISVTDLPLKAEADYTIVAPSGNIIGQLEQTAELRKIEPGYNRAKSTINGFFEGPKDIKWSPGYAVWLRQADRGLIEGAYSQFMFHGAGRFYSLVRRRYLYNNDKTLPFDEIWHYRILRFNVEISEGRRRFHYRATASYTPAGGEHGSIEKFETEFHSALQHKEALLVFG